MTPKKPMLACDAPAVLNFPLIVSPKLDGIRCTVWGQQPVTRALKPVPNKFVRETLAAARLPAVFDGELVVGAANHPDVYRRTTSGIMSHEGQPDFTFWVFDYVPQLADLESCEYRLKKLAERTSALALEYPWLRVLPQAWVLNQAALDGYEQQMLAEGFEGIIARRPDAPYKHGRSTANEGYLLKVKRFVDTEVEVVGVEELMHNANEATVNELGHTQRSSAMAGLVPAGVLGALICRWGVHTFKVGTGFTAEHRAELWQKRDALIGSLAKIKYFEQGMKDLPRHPVWLGFRDGRDM